MSSTYHLARLAQRRGVQHQLHRLGNQHEEAAHVRDA